MRKLLASTSQLKTSAQMFQLEELVILTTEVVNKSVGMANV